MDGDITVACHRCGHESGTASGELWLTPALNWECTRTCQPPSRQRTLRKFTTRSPDRFVIRLEPEQYEMLREAAATLTSRVRQHMARGGAVSMNDIAASAIADWLERFSKKERKDA